MATLQNKPLKEFQESVYQFRLSSIQYSEATRANIQQQRRLPKQIIQAVKMGIGAASKAIMGKSGSSMLDFIGGGGETMKYMNKFSQMGFAAKGKYVNSPTLMMVGEEGRGEVVIPTERIRKGLPINAGVAAELGSIGVPGFQTGGPTDAGNMYANITPSGSASSNVGTDTGSMYANITPGFFGKRYGKNSAFGKAGGF